jgi:hypothetical protein
MLIDKEILNLHVQPYKDTIDQQNNLIKALEDYISVLSDECTDLSSYLYARNPTTWASTRSEEGAACRDNIERIKRELYPKPAFPSGRNIH